MRNKPLKSSRPLNSRESADLFTQLARLEAAGLPASQAVELIFKQHPTLSPYYPTLARAVKAGQSLAATGRKTGMLTESQFAILSAAEASGQQISIYDQLAKFYAGKAARLAKLKARLVLPVLIFTLSIWLAPLPEIFRNTLSLWGYVKLCGGQMLTIGLAAYTGLKLPEICKILHIEPAWHRLQLRFPFVRNWIIRRQLNDFFNYLGLMLAAGMAFSEALPIAVKTLGNSSLRSRFNQPEISKHLKSGSSVYTTLSATTLLNATALQIINTSEFSGKLAEGLIQFSKLEAESIALQDEALAEWIPRIVYILIAASMAYSIISAYTVRFSQLPV